GYVNTAIGRIRDAVRELRVNRISQVTPAAVSRLVELLRARTVGAAKRRLSATTINHYVAALRHFAAWADREGRTGGNALEGVSGVRGTKAKRRRALST